jgi:hypothetical protein
MTLTVNGKNITELVGSMTLDSNVDTLGDQLNFSMAYSLPHLKAEVNLGDHVTLYDGREVFSGIVVTKTRSENSQDFVCFDFAFYLNKSKVIKQFNKIRADAAIKQLLAEFDVPMGYIAPMSVVITKIFYDKEVSSVIGEILEEVANASGTQHVMEMNTGKLEIYPDAERLVKALVKYAGNLPAVDCMQTISSPTKIASIEEMKNSIKLYTGGDNSVKVYAEAKNDNLVKKYGLLQETQSLEDKEIAQAKNIAQNRLKQLSKIPISAGVTVLGSFDLRAGRIVEVSEPMTGLVGKYKIKAASHSIGTIHTTTLDLEAM